MFTQLPRMAHRCYHVWTTKTHRFERNPYGAMVKISDKCCSRCKATKESVELVCEAPKRDEQLAAAISA